MKPAQGGSAGAATWQAPHLRSPALRPLNSSAPISVGGLHMQAASVASQSCRLPSGLLTRSPCPSAPCAALQTWSRATWTSPRAAWVRAAARVPTVSQVLVPPLIRPAAALQLRLPHGPPLCCPLSTPASAQSWIHKRCATRLTTTPLVRVGGLAKVACSAPRCVSQRCWAGARGGAPAHPAAAPHHLPAGVVAMMASTYTGQFEPVQAMDAVLQEIKQACTRAGGGSCWGAGMPAMHEAGRPRLPPPALTAPCSCPAPAGPRLGLRAAHARGRRQRG